MQEVKKIEAAPQGVDQPCWEPIPGRKAGWHRHSLFINFPGSNDPCCSLKGNWAEKPREVDFIWLISTNVQLGASHSAGLFSVPPPILNKMIIFVQATCKHPEEREMTNSQYELVKNKFCRANRNSFVTGWQACG